MATSLEAGQWSRLLSTPAGAEIAALLRPFQEQAPHLAPSQEPLIEAARSAIRRLTGSVGLAMLSVGAVDGAITALRSSLPGELPEDLGMELRCGFSHALKSSLWDELQLLAAIEKSDTLSVHPLWAVAAVGLWLELRDSQWASFRVYLPASYWAPVRRALTEGFEALLCCRMIHLAEAPRPARRTAEPALGELVLPLLELFHAGNLPVGRLEDGSFLLLVV